MFSLLITWRNKTLIALRNGRKSCILSGYFNSRRVSKQFLEMTVFPEQWRFVFNCRKRKKKERSEWRLKNPNENLLWTWMLVCTQIMIVFCPKEPILDLWWKAVSVTCSFQRFSQLTCLPALSMTYVTCFPVLCATGLLVISQLRTGCMFSRPFSPRLPFSRLWQTLRTGKIWNYVYFPHPTWLHVFRCLI